jgi:Ca-activated chloride channel family protein
VAREGQGIYRQLTADDSDVDTILNVVSGSRLDEKFDEGPGSLDLHSDQWREEGPWLLLLLLPIIALAFRRGYLAVLVVAVLPFPQTSHAFEWSDLWLNENQQAAKAFEQGNAEQAAKQFQDPNWKAAANYRAGNYQQAIEALQGIEQPDALYNRGNALAKAGNLQQAIEAYDKVLETNPDHEDARYNRDLLKKYLEQQQQNNDQQGDQGQDQQQQSGDQDQQQQQGQQGDQAQNSQQQQGENDRAGQQQNQQQRNEQGEQDQSQQQAQRGDDNEQEKQQGKEQQQASKQQDDASDDGDKQAHLSQSDDSLDDDPESRQMMEQWLRRIPDDPGGLLRRKFRYQSQMDSHQAEREKKPW